MFFEYDDYFWNCLCFPMSMVLIFSIVLICCVIRFIKKKTGDLSRLIVVIGAILILSYTVVPILLYGGIALISEKEDDAIEMYGYIERVDELERNVMPKGSTSDKYNVPEIESFYGVKYTINGKKCSAFVRGYFKEGDYVFVRYLPKSSYVLYIEHQRNISADSQPSDES